MSTLPEQLLRDTGVHNVKDLQVLVPALIVTSTTSETQTTARIRGVGTVGDNPGLESSVGIVIAGVARSRNGVAFGEPGGIGRGSWRASVSKYGWSSVGAASLKQKKKIKHT